MSYREVAPGQIQNRIHISQLAGECLGVSPDDLEVVREREGLGVSREN